MERTREILLIITKKEGMVMKSKANTDSDMGKLVLEGMIMRRKANINSDLSARPCRADIGKLVLEGMMTIFIVLIFLFIAQNWVLTNIDDTPFTSTCSLSDGRVGLSGPVPYETNKIIDGYNLILQ